MGRQNKALPQISKLSNLTGWLRKGRRAIRNWGSLEQSYKMSRKYAVLAWSAPASHSGYKGGKPARSCLGWNEVVEDSSLATWWWVRRLLTILELLVFKWAVQTALYLTFPCCLRLCRCDFDPPLCTLMQYVFSHNSYMNKMWKGDPCLHAAFLFLR